MISKDRDFRDSHLLRRTPRRLLVVSTGNISNDDLLALFNEHLAAIALNKSRDDGITVAAGHGHPPRDAIGRRRFRELERNRTTKQRATGQGDDDCGSDAIASRND